MAAPPFDIDHLWIDASLYPAEESNAIRTVEHNLRDLKGYLADFRAALLLFQTCKQNMDTEFAKLLEANRDHLFLLSSWRSVACRDGAMTMWHFSNMIVSIKESFGKCPTLRRKINTKAIKEAWKQFSFAFPDFTKMRNAVAHSSELAKSEFARSENSVTEIRQSGYDITGVSSLMIRGTIHNNTYTMTHLKKIISYELSQETVNELTTILQKIISAFSEVNKIEQD